jgi:hypothetical protein
MLCSEMTTAIGTGTWDASYEISLVTVKRVYTELSGDKQAIVVAYELRFKRPSSSSWDFRIFDSEEKRESFLSESFSHLNLDRVPDNLGQKPCFNLLSDLVGEYVSSVTFVMDYLQIGFNGHNLSLYVWPIVEDTRGRLTEGDEGYRNAVCSLIGKRVKAADEYLDAGIVVDFEEGHRLQVPLRVSGEFDLPEIAMYQGTKGIWNVWQVGAKPYA